MSVFAHDLLEVFTKPTADIFAWVLLPNHYHVLCKIYNFSLLRKRLGQLHGRSSHTWNVEENCAGRKCFHSALFKDIKSEAHWESTVNYIHHNPVKHGYVKKWTDWPYGSAIAYLSSTPRESVQSHWKQYPITGMGKGWDE